jgi:hypothetical protein
VSSLAKGVSAKKSADLMAPPKRSRQSGLPKLSSAFSFLLAALNHGSKQACLIYLLYFAEQ